MNATRLILFFSLIGFFFTLSPSSFGQHPGDKESAEVARADADLNAVYKQALSNLGQSQQARLREEERAWLKNLDAEAARLGREGGATGGSALRVDVLNARAELIRERTQVLKNWQHNVLPSATVQSPISIIGGVIGGNPNGTKSSVVASGVVVPDDYFTQILRSTKELTEVNFRGLCLGMTAGQVSQFCTANSLTIMKSNTMGNLPIMEEYSIPGVIPRQRFISFIHASNEKTDANLVDIGCYFASPIPGKRDEPTLVRAKIVARFGAGVSLDEMRSDLDKKFGEEDPGSVNQDFKILHWSRKTSQGIQVHVTAQLDALVPGALWGTLGLEFDSDDLSNEMRKSFDQAFKELDAARKKDTTKPEL